MGGGATHSVSEPTNRRLKMKVVGNHVIDRKIRLV